MTMHCGRARHLLWPDAGPRALNEEIEHARAHLAECQWCRRFFEEGQALADEVRHLARNIQAPSAVRERVFAALATARSSPRGAGAQSRKVRRVGAAVLIGAAAVGALWLGWGRVRPLPWAPETSTLVEDHLRSLDQDAVDASAPAVVEQWLGRRVPFAVHVPDLPGAALEGARLCFLHGRQGAVVRFRVDGRLVSYYVMPWGQAEAAEPAPSDFREAADAGYNVVTWRRAGLVYALVGDLPRERLAQLAHLCAVRQVALR